MLGLFSSISIFSHLISFCSITSYLISSYPVSRQDYQSALFGAGVIRSPSNGNLDATGSDADSGCDVSASASSSASSTSSTRNHSLCLSVSVPELLQAAQADTVWRKGGVCLLLAGRMKSGFYCSPGSQFKNLFLLISYFLRRVTRCGFSWWIVVLPTDTIWAICLRPFIWTPVSCCKTPKSLPQLLMFYLLHRNR